MAAKPSNILLEVFDALKRYESKISLPKLAPDGGGGEQERRWYLLDKAQVQKAWSLDDDPDISLSYAAGIGFRKLELKRHRDLFDDPMQVLLVARFYHTDASGSRVKEARSDSYMNADDCAMMAHVLLEIREVYRRRASQSVAAGRLFVGAP